MGHKSSNRVNEKRSSMTGNGSSSGGGSGMLKLTLIPRPELRDEHQYCTSLVRPARRGARGGVVGKVFPSDNCVSSVQYDVLAESLSAMLEQEKRCYQCGDYLHLKIKGKEEVAAVARHGGKYGSKLVVDEYCRDQIVLWTYRVVDYFNIDREVVAIAMSYLDRFMSIKQCNRRTFKLAATTTLQLAVKIHHPHSLKLVSILSDLSRGEFDARDITDMENDISRALDWKLHPPTALSIVSILLMIVPPTCLRSPHVDNVQEAVLDFALFFAELSVCDYYFVTGRQSIVALASILNAMEGLGFLTASHPVYVHRLCHSLRLSHDCADVVDSRERLWILYERSEECSKNGGGGTCGASSEGGEDSNASSSGGESRGGGGGVTGGVGGSGDEKLLSSPAAANISSPVCISQTHSTINGFRHARG